MWTRGVVVVVSLALVLSACGDDGAGVLPDAPPAPDAPMIAPPCEPPTGPGTMHGANVMADETWTAAASPHVVTFSISVRNATLTLEPCAVVRIRPGFIITVGDATGMTPAALVAHGVAIANGDGSTTLREVTFERETAAMPWGSIRAFPTGRVDLEHVRLVGGADPLTAQQGGGMVIAAGPGGNMGLTRNLRLVDVRIEGSAGFGVNVGTRAAFTADSANVTITGAAAQPITVDGAAVSTIPSGTYTGNTVDAIRVANAGSLLDPSITFPSRGIPYHVAGSFSMSPSMTAAAGGLSTLTIEAGVTIAFTDGATFALGASNGGLPANISPVRLIAQGTQAQPIVLTSGEATRAAGDWTGLEWHGGPPTGNVMSYVRIEYAGADSGTGGFGCGEGDNDAALIIRNWRPDDAFITSSTFASSARGGIVSGWQTDLGGPSLVGNNTFVGIANGCNVARWRDGNGSCPATPPVCL